MSETTTATLTWQGGSTFAARSGSGHELATASVAEAGHVAPSPMELMLVAVAGCTALDVVAILEKMRQPLAALAVEVAGQRAEGHPKRFTSIEIKYHLRGAGLSRERVERAVELSRTTYCSALASLRPDCPVTTTIEIT